MFSKIEKETIIIFNEEEENATVTTLSKKVADRYIKSGYKPFMIDVESYRFKVSKRYIKTLICNEKRKSFYLSGKND